MGIITFSLSGRLCIARCMLPSCQWPEASHWGPGKLVPNLSHGCGSCKIDSAAISPLTPSLAPTLHSAWLHIFVELSAWALLPRLGSLKNKRSCAGFSPVICRSLSFHRYPFLSLASSVKLLYVSPPLGLCAALVGARVLNKSEQLDPNSWSALTLSGHAHTFTDTHNAEC